MSQENSEAPSIGLESARVKQSADGPGRDKGIVPGQGLIQPRNWDPSWRQFMLYRKSDDLPRGPMYSLGNPDYWAGGQAPWSEWAKAVDMGFDLGFLPWLNDIVVVDCDVKSYWGGFVAVEGKQTSVRVGERVVKYGLDDLAQIVTEVGHSMDELDTYTVKTKSGGRHLYFQRNGCDLMKMGHREGWRVDVIAGENNWVAAPPTPGYEVVRDVPVMDMPAWFCAILKDVPQRFPRLGGARRVAFDQRIAQAKQGGRPVVEGESIRATYVRLECELITLANEVGGWNAAIFEVACEFHKRGYDPDWAEALILRHAQPETERDERQARATIRSARDYKDRESGRE